MEYLMGIDIGTSSLKTMIIDESGEIKALSSQSYQYDSPETGYAEQDPEVWWNACIMTIRDALKKSGIPGERITAMSFSGQMHGVVLLDGDGKVVRPAILHCDVRSGKQVRQINERLGPDGVRELVMNPVYTGFLLTSLLWVRENEPQNYERVRKVCLPKDYIKYKLTGIVSTDYSDASATLVFDIRNHCWSRDIIVLFDIPESIFPPCCDTYSRVDHVSENAAAVTGLSKKTLVVSGGGDQIMQGIGSGMTEIGMVTTNIGSSGQVCFQTDKPIVNPELSTNVFCGYKKNRWIAMGAIMHAGLALKWIGHILGEDSYTKLDTIAQKALPGSGGVIFLPYLNGERTPHTNPDLSAMFFGCNMNTGRPEMVRSVMEGVAFAMMQCMETCEKLGLKRASTVASGGGAKSSLWLQIQSDVYGLPLKVARTEEQACLGAAIVAGVGAGVYRTVEDGCAAVVRYQEKIIVPDKENHKIYMDYYALFKDIYPANEELLRQVTRMRKKSV
jgi:xylulokinase